MKTVILVPTYNEKDNLPKLIPAVQLMIETDILVIDDNSPDGTGKIADELARNNPKIKVLHRAKKEGLGRAYVAGYKWALANDYDIIIQMDCDFSHDPKYLTEMLDLIKTNDLVLGSRYSLGVSCYNWPLRRILLSKLANMYTETFGRLPVKDSTGGFKCFRSDVLKSIDIDSLRSNGYAFQIEVTYRAYKMGFRIKELPIIFYERTLGTSKISRYIIIEAFFLVLKMFLGVYRFKGLHK